MKLCNAVDHSLPSILFISIYSTYFGAFLNSFIPSEKFLTFKISLVSSSSCFIFFAYIYFFFLPPLPYLLYHSLSSEKCCVVPVRRRPVVKVTAPTPGSAVRGPSPLLRVIQIKDSSLVLTLRPGCALPAFPKFLSLIDVPFLSLPSLLPKNQ